MKFEEAIKLNNLGERFGVRFAIIYLLLDEEGTPRYVGKTIDPVGRLQEHRKTKNWIASMLVLEYVPATQFVPREMYWIKRFRTMGFPLENKNSGGSGLPYFSQEQKDNLKQIRKEGRGFKGHTEESKNKISSANKISHTGVKLSPEHAAAIGLGHKGISPAETTKQKIRETLTGHAVTEETRDKIRHSKKGSVPWIKGRKHTEETKEKIKAKRAGQKLSAESRAKQSASLKATWARRKASGL